MSIQLFRGDCLEIIPTLPAQSVDAILTDLPYGTTACTWDTVIPFPDLWRVVKHVLKPRGVFVTTASQPFTSAMVMSNVEWFRYEWCWDKRRLTGFLDARRKPMKRHENIVVFSANGHTYNPQMGRGEPYKHNGKRGPGGQAVTRDADALREICPIDNEGERFPVSIIETRSERGEHPTQKPVALYEYLTLTYTNPGDTILDLCAGSGTTGVACIKTGRNFIGIEKREDYFEIMSRRIQEAQQQMVMPV